MKEDKSAARSRRSREISAELEDGTYVESDQSRAISVESIIVEISKLSRDGVGVSHDGSGG